MRPICWPHISDIQLSASDAWSQDVVLRAMCERIEKLRQVRIHDVKHTSLRLSKYQVRSQVSCCSCEVTCGAGTAARLPTCHHYSFFADYCNSGSRSFSRHSCD